MTAPHHDLLPLLRAWLPRQRWYAGKGSTLAELTLAAQVQLRAGEPALHHLVVAVESGEGALDHYQLLLGLRSEPVPERLEFAQIGQIETPDGPRVAYDGVHDYELTALLLEWMGAGAAEGPLRFTAEPDVRLDTSLHSLVLGAEQSNTSLIFGDAYILKLFRRVAPGVNPDLELHRALQSVGCEHIAAPLGAIEGVLPEDGSSDSGKPVTFGLLQEFLSSGTDGWHMATTSVRDLYAEGDLHANEVGGDFAGEAHRLGSATASVHLDLARALGSARSSAEEAELTAAQMRDRLDTALRVVPELEQHAPALRTAYDEVAELRDTVAVQRIHGDLHLGQVLRTFTGWVILDFEGEPARPLAERTRPMSPLRDVAGMLRSFDYAARHLLADHPAEPQLAYRADEWAERNREAFTDGYAEVSGSDPRKSGVLLRAFELDKAVYEVGYEARHRPTWLPIPLGSIARLVDERR